MKSIHLISFVLVLSLHSIFGQTNRTLIAVLSQESVKNNGQSYIAASYVKYLESAGARVVPVLINQNKEYYEHIVNSTDGLLIPGGGRDLHTSGYAKAGKMMWDYAMHKLSRPYPIWGTCLGFELLLTLVDPNLTLNECDSTDVSNKLDFKSANPQNTRLFKSADPQLIDIITKENVTYNSHHKCFLFDNIRNKTENITNFFTILTTTEDLNGRQYVSTIESINGSFPVYGTQWHPEKNQFEFAFNSKIKRIPHSMNAVHVSQYMANFFVDQCRQSTRPALNLDEEHKLLIYNYEPQYTGAKANYEFEQVYFFNSSGSNKWCVYFTLTLILIILFIN